MRKLLRTREWGGEGKIIMSPSASYTITLVLSSYRTTLIKSPALDMTAVKNDVELEGFRRAYLRDGVAFVQFLAWLEDKILNKGYDISEWEASQLPARVQEETTRLHGACLRDHLGQRSQRRAPPLLATQSNGRLPVLT
ncbi:hypothetical protein BDZ89DRAFT_1137899 [Hymenopellis radicata]|nr:hypothetical protein BDZ89DRAFT_1137899 [Hymenopellis radicata]